MQHHFATMEQVIAEVLRGTCKELALLGIVETRTKRIPSFAEKSLRKRSKNQDPQMALPPDPLVRLGDLRQRICAEMVRSGLEQAAPVLVIADGAGKNQLD